MACSGCGHTTAPSAGHDDDHPIVIGIPNGDDPELVALDAQIFGRDRGDKIWVTGDGVTVYVAAGWIRGL